MRILILSRYDNLGASSRIRMFQYIPYLNSHGIEVTVAPLLRNDYLIDLYAGRRRNLISIAAAYLYRLGKLLDSHRYDVLWIEKELFPWIPSFMERLPKLYNVPYILDLDDAIFHSYDEHPNKIIRLLLGGKLRKVIAGATWIVAGNLYLKQYANKITTRVSVLPSVIDRDRYSVAKNRSSTNCLFTIGWIGSPATAGCIQKIMPVLKSFCSKHDARLLLVGAGKVDLPGVPVVNRSWSEETEVDDITEFDVGIMPLYDTPWYRGKSGFKLIQYMASGKPVVASPIGVNSEIVKNNKNGFLAETEADWLKALSILYFQPEKRLSMGRVGRKMVEENYCFQVTAPRLLKIIRNAVK